MSDGMRRELVYLSSYATNRYFIPNWGNYYEIKSMQNGDIASKSFRFATHKRINHLS